MDYGVKRSDVTSQIQMMLRGVPVATFPKENSMDYTVRVWLPQKQIDDFSTILNTLIVTPKGKIPLSKIASLDSNKEPSTITRDGLYVAFRDYCQQRYLAHSLCTRADEIRHEQKRCDARVHQNQNPTWGLQFKPFLS